MLERARRLPNPSWLTKKIDFGAENHVFNFPGFRDNQGRLSRVVALQSGNTEYWDTKTANKTYAVQNIFNILFPKNFPKIYAVFADDEIAGEVSDEVRKRRYSSALRGRFAGVGSIRQKLFGLQPGSHKDFFSCMYDFNEFAKKKSPYDFESLVLSDFDLNAENIQRVKIVGGVAIYFRQTRCIAADYWCAMHHRL
jgi:hypothetical protein